MASHTAQCKTTLYAAARLRKGEQAAMFDALSAELPPLQQRRLRRIVKGDASTWLSVLPLERDGYDLSATQFRDQLAIRYGREPSALPSTCDGCSAQFSLHHSLDCKKGGLVKRGHDDLCDSDA